MQPTSSNPALPTRPGQPTPTGTRPTTSPPSLDSARPSLGRSALVGETVTDGEQQLAPRGAPTRPTRKAPRQPEPALELIALSEPVEVDIGELITWAKQRNYGYDATQQRVYDPKSGASGGDQATPSACTTVIALGTQSANKVSAIGSGLSLSQFCNLAVQISPGLPTVRALFFGCARMANHTMLDRKANAADRAERMPAREAELDMFGDATMLQHPLTPLPITADQLYAALPVPESHYGVFHLAPAESIDVSSAGFGPCVGIAVLAKHANGTRSLGMTHLNPECVENVGGQFQSMLDETTGGGRSPCEFWMFGGGRVDKGSRTLVLSMMDFMATYGGVLAGTHLFGEREDDEAYVVRSMPHETTLHRAEHPEEHEALEEREEQLAAHTPQLEAMSQLAELLLVAPPFLHNVCRAGRHLMDPRNQRPPSDEGVQK